MGKYNPTAEQNARAQDAVRHSSMLDMRPEFGTELVTEDGLTLVQFMAKERRRWATLEFITVVEYGPDGIIGEHTERNPDYTGHA